MSLPVIKNSIGVDDDIFPTLSLAERDRRWRVIRAMMSEQGLDALVVFGWGRTATDQYLTNESSHAIVLFTQTEDPIRFLGDVPLDRYDDAGKGYERWTSAWVHGNPIENAASAVRERGLDKATLGVVGLSSRQVGEWSGVISWNGWQAVLKALPGVTWVDVSGIYETITMSKSPEEQELIRKASAIGEAACAAFVNGARVGNLESVSTGAAVGAIVQRGGWFRAPFILERSGHQRFAWGQPEWFNIAGKPRTLAAGDSIASEIFAFYGGMESQQQIDVVLGKPDALLRELESVCQESYQAGIDALRPGMMFSELAEVMEAPLAEHKVWNTGPMVQVVSPVIYNSATRLNPGVDPALSVLPKLPSGVAIDGDFQIEEGIAFAFEPNALREGKRVCIGGTVMLTDRGIEELNTIPNQLQVVEA